MAPHTVVMSMGPVSLPSRRPFARRNAALPILAHRLLASMVAARKCTPPRTRDQPHWSLQGAQGEWTWEGERKIMAVEGPRTAQSGQRSRDSTNALCGGPRCIGHCKMQEG